MKVLEHAERFSKLCKSYGFPERDLSTLIVLTRRAVRAWVRAPEGGGSPRVKRAREKVERQAAEMLIGVTWPTYNPVFQGAKMEEPFTLPFLES